MAGIFMTVHSAQQNVDALNRKAKATVDIDNGTAVTLAIAKTGDWDVFTATKASAGASGVGIACSPEVDKLIVGEVYGGVDPRYFTNKAGKAFDVIMPQKFDVFQMSIDCFAEDYDPATVTTATRVELAANGQWKAVASATESYTGIAFALGMEKDIVVGNEHVKAWIVECINN